MYNRKRFLLTCFGFVLFAVTAELAVYAIPVISSRTNTTPTLTEEAIANALGWQSYPGNRCGGYYLEGPIQYPREFIDTDKLLISSDEGLFSFHGTSISKGKVTVTRAGQQLTANKAYLYRDLTTGKLSAIKMIGNVHLREPNQLVIGAEANYDLKTHIKKLQGILYRSTVYAKGTPPPVSYQEQQTTRKIEQLSAWGRAGDFVQAEPKIYDFSDVSYSTCPPLSETWHVKAKKMELNKNTGRGYATHARLYLQNVPVFYTPYFNFPIDARRQTGFLFPRFGTSSRSGGYFSAPFYWNLAPNYDTTITPNYLSQRGLQITDLFRYLTPVSHGEMTASVLPSDRLFSEFQSKAKIFYADNPNPTTQAELNQLEKSSTTRHAFSWVDTSQYNENWSSHINYNYVGDDYYLHDFSGNLAEISNNELLQEADVNYASQHWDAGVRAQSYQTLNQLDEALKIQNGLPVTATVYSRLPQITLSGNYPDEPFGLQYFIYNDVTRFLIRPFPGNDMKLPIGNRVNVQPGISRPYSLPYFFINPRIQFALTQYVIGLNNSSRTPERGLPILDINSGLFFDRDLTFANYHFKQTLEPQFYYTYIPFRDQSELPLFDTALNTLTYDQLFTYNRFSGFDRIGDANQISLGVTSRFIDDVSGYEKASAAIGQIYYFKKREVTLCSPQKTDAACQELQEDPNNLSSSSPISGRIKYNVNPAWSATVNTIWNVKQSRFDNQNITLQYKPESRKILNLGYNFVRNTANVLPWVPPTPEKNLSQTTFSFSWPVTRDWEVLGLWTENWNQTHMQNVLSGLQYDSCCWAVRLVGGKTLITQNGTGGTYTYNKQLYLEFSLKGLGTFGPSGDASSLLAGSIPGYQSNFGRNY